MSDLHEKYELKIITLSPLHIGSGTHLRRNLDFLIEDKEVLIIDQGGFYRLVLEHLITHFGETSAAQKMRELGGKSIYDTIRQTGLDHDLITKTGSQAVSYRFPIKDIDPAGINQQPLSLFIKTPQHRPYIPGSSLKGSLRSSYLRVMSRDDPSIPINYSRGHRPDARFADDTLEYQKFSSETLGGKRNFPNDDIWRGVYIADSDSRSPQTMVLAKGEVYPLDSSKQFDLFFEVIPPNKVFQSTFTLDRWLFLESAKRSRGTERDPNSAFSRDFLTLFNEELRNVVDSDTRHLFNQEWRFLTNIENENHYNVAEIRQTKTFMSQIANVIKNLQDNEFVTRVGFGTGWMAKTLGDKLQDVMDDIEFKNLVNKFKLGKREWRREQTIPYTRLVVDADGFKRVPTGWIKVRMDPIL